MKNRGVPENQEIIELEGKQLKRFHLHGCKVHPLSRLRFH